MSFGIFFVLRERKMSRSLSWTMYSTLWCRMATLRARRPSSTISWVLDLTREPNDESCRVSLLLRFCGDGGTMADMFGTLAAEALPRVSAIH